MNIDVLPKPEDLGRKERKEKAAVVFDVLRATSTVVTALASGCRAVIPAAEIEEAREIARDLREGRCPGRFGKDPAHFYNLSPKEILLAGERGGERVPGFPHGNSPLEYTKEVSKGKVLVLTTTNGTRAIRLAAKDASVLLIGSLLNARAVARLLWQLQKDLVLVCAGTNGNFSLEDALAAGIVIKELFGFVQEENPDQNRPVNRRQPMPKTKNGPPNLSDLAITVYRLAMWYGDDPLQAFFDSRHGQKLLQLGLLADLRYCSRLNLFDLVPVYRQGLIFLP